MPNLKYALVLSGGGFKGAFQLGALNYLNKNWSDLCGTEDSMNFEVIAGVSVGSLNGSMLAMDQLDLLNQLWSDVAKNGVGEIYTSDFIDTSGSKLSLKLDYEILKNRFFPDFKAKIRFSDLFRLIGKRSRGKFVENLARRFLAEIKPNFDRFSAIADNSPLQQKLQNVLDKDKVSTTFYSGFVSLDNGEYYSVRHDEYLSNTDFVNGVVASTAMPIVWSPIPNIHFNKDGKEINAQNSVDGGIKNVSPLGDVLRHISKNDSNQEYLIIVINCNSGEHKLRSFEKSNIGRIALRSLNEIAITEIFNNDLSQFVKINDLVTQVQEGSPKVRLFKYDYRKGERTDIPLRRVRIVIINPDQGVLGNTLLADEHSISTRMQHGELKAKKALEKYASQPKTEYSCVT